MTVKVTFVSATQKLEQERIVKQECLRDVLREIPSVSQNLSPN